MFKDINLIAEIFNCATSALIFYVFIKFRINTQKMRKVYEFDLKLLKAHKTSIDIQQKIGKQYEIISELKENNATDKEKKEATEKLFDLLVEQRGLSQEFENIEREAIKTLKKL